MPIAFFCRAKPQKCDAFSIFKQAARVFIGYPLLRAGATYDPKALRSCLVDPSGSRKEWNASSGRNSNYTRNRNFVREVNNVWKDGAFVLIPRPEQGEVHLGRVTGPFEVLDAPPWGEDYLFLRCEQGLDTDDKRHWHIADVAQGWPVEEYRRVDLSRIPGWLRRSTFGQTTYGVFRKPHPVEASVTAYDVLKRLYEGAPAIPPPWTLEIEEIKKRLVETLTPSSFEHLIISILQLENLSETWQQTGGPGDGGIDGLGFNEAGETVGLMQAKYSADQFPRFPERVQGKDIRYYLAVLLPVEGPPPDGTVLLNLDWIARKVLRHWRGLPQALSMRIGETLESWKTIPYSIGDEPTKSVDPCDDWSCMRMSALHQRGSRVVSTFRYLSPVSFAGEPK